VDIVIRAPVAPATGVALSTFRAFCESALSSGDH
jgi:hypothetical protein